MSNEQSRLDWISDVTAQKAPDLRRAERRHLGVRRASLSGAQGASPHRAPCSKPRASGSRPAWRACLPRSWPRPGSGSPVIGFLGEYDALAGLSQEAGVAEPRAVRPGGAGQGCGHNMLGAGSMLAAVLVKEYLAANGLARHGPLLRLPWRGGRLRQDVHGSRRRLRRPGRGVLLARVDVQRRDVGPDAGEHPGLLPLQGSGGARGRRAAPWAERPRRRRVDERRRELPPRAHAVRLSGALRRHQLRRHLAERGPGQRRGALPSPRAERGAGAAPSTSGSARWRRAPR